LTTCLLSNIYTHFSYTVKGMTFCAGIMLRSFLSKEDLHRALFNTAHIEKLAHLITDATFDVSSDAIDSFLVASYYL